LHPTSLHGPFGDEVLGGSDLMQPWRISGTQNQTRVSHVVSDTVPATNGHRFDSLLSAVTLWLVVGGERGVGKNLSIRFFHQDSCYAFLCLFPCKEPECLFAPLLSLRLS
jgi:hypothetical protein